MRYVFVCLLIVEVSFCLWIPNQMDQIFKISVFLLIDKKIAGLHKHIPVVKSKYLFLYFNISLWKTKIGYFEETITTFGT